MTEASSTERSFRSAKRDLRKVLGVWSKSVSSDDVSREELSELKGEADLCFLAFVKEGDEMLKAKEGSDEMEDLKETLGDIDQNYHALVREFNSINSRFGLKEFKTALDLQNQTISERLDNFSGTISNLEKRVNSIETSDSITLKGSKLDPSTKEFLPSRTLFSGSDFPCSSKQTSALPTREQTQAPLKDTAPPCSSNQFTSQPGLFSVPATKELRSDSNLSSSSQFMDVAGFILRHGLNSNNFKFDGNPMEYVAFIRHFNSCYASKISDSDILFTCLFDMLEGRALQAVKGFRQIPSTVALPKVLDTLKTRFGNPRRVQEAMRDKLMSTKRLKDDLDCLAEFLSDLNNYKVTSEYLSVSDFVSPNFISAVIERLPFRLRDLFLDQLAHRDLLNRKECWVDELIAFIEKRISILESDLVRNRNRQAADKDRSLKQPSKVFFAANCSNENVSRVVCNSKASTFRNEPKSATKNVKRNLSECLYCLKPGHLIYSCYNFIAESLEKRTEFASEKNLCISCLRLAHGDSRCPVRSSPRLPQCKKNHHALLCSCSRESKAESFKPVDNAPGAQSCKKVSGVNHIAKGCGGVRLHVLPVVVSNECGEEKEVYAMFDSGSEESLISQEVVDFLSVKGDSIDITMLTADGRSSDFSTKQVNIKVSPLSRNATYDITGALVMESLPSIGSNFPSIDNLFCHEHLKDLVSSFPILADKRLHLIIGAKECFISRHSRIRQAPPGIPWAAKTKLGWVIYGEDKSLSSPHVKRFNFVKISNADLDKKLDLWLETTFDESRHDETKALSLNDGKTISIYEKSVTRVGKNYSISLPFKSEPVTMPNNFEFAKKRMLSLSKSLLKSPELLSAYVKFMKQLFTDGHAIVLTDEQVVGEVGRIWYLNHHMVHSSGKDRVVFNCSGEFDHVSLNKLLLKGPTLSNSLIGVFLRFRNFQYALVGDVRKMYYQCFVNEPFQDFLRFLWFRNDSPECEIIHCRMTRLAFGLLCAQSGAQFCLQKTVSNNEVGVSKLTVDLASSCFYVDDLLASVCTKSDLLILFNEIKVLLESGGFPLTKFYTNCLDLRGEIPPDECAPSPVTINFNKDDDVVHKALGMQWNPDTDSISFCFNLEVGAYTRRGILATFSQIFDPIGIIQPLLIVPKLLIRTLCNLKLNWDDAIPEEQKRVWMRWLQNVNDINLLHVDRCLVPCILFERIEIHAFSDASSEAYASVVFLRIVYPDSVRLNFVMGKSKIAPRKETLTVPKLELIAACLSVRLVQKVVAELIVNVDKFYYWVDAVSVLHLIRNHEKRFKLFVANRLSLIHHYTETSEWRYCPTTLNVADVGSRSIVPTDINKLKPWIEGPQFLKVIETEWPSFDCNMDDVVLSSFLLKPLGVGRSEGSTLDDLIARYSSYNRLLRAVAYLSAFKLFCYKGTKKKTITSNDLDVARDDLCRFVQFTCFSFLLDFLAGNSVSKDYRTELNSLKKLSPFLDDKGLIRVGGRLQRSSLAYDVKHPILLPKRHHLVKLVVFHYHELSRHSGYTYTLAQIRSIFWIVSGQSAVRNYLRDCFYCTVRRAKIGQQVMAPLPSERIASGGRPFAVTGVDFFGPEFLFVRLGESSSRRKVKRYGCIFTCFATRAVHLEVCHSLSTDSFLCALLRFIYCRGHSTKEIWSDQGTNFVGADNEISRCVRDLDESRIVNCMSRRGIIWRYSPARSPHQSGVWEVLIRETKVLLKSVYNGVAYRTLNEEEFLTFIKEIENILNCRPLTPLSDDPNDFSYLSPMSILNLCLDPSLPLGVFVKSDGLRKSWRTAQLMADSFWNDWRLFYLPLLQKRHKWTGLKPNLTVGDMVLLKDSHLARNQWSRARITKVFPDKDGVVRRVELMLPDRKCYVRDLRYVCPLEAHI